MFGMDIITRCSRISGAVYASVPQRAAIGSPSSMMRAEPKSATLIVWVWADSKRMFSGLMSA
jgi:hypothetical protein